MDKKTLKLFRESSGYKCNPILVYIDPALPLKIVEYLVENKLKFPLPLTGDDRVVYQVYAEMQSGQMSRDILMGLSMNKDEMRTAGTAMKCFLINGHDYKTIAKYTGESVEAIKVFEKLCFNVLDRLDEGMYISQIVYPNTRNEQYTKNYFENTDPGDLILRACYEEKDIARIMYLNGLRMTDEEWKEHGAKSWVDIYGDEIHEKKVAEYEAMMIAGNLLHDKRLTKSLMENWKLKNMKGPKLDQSQSCGVLLQEWKEYGY